MNRYSAKLLFQYRVVTDEVANQRRTCEERIIVLECESAKEALTQAKQAARQAEHNYKNDSGGTAYFEFVGVLDLLHLGVECEPNEVWYAIREMVSPMERRQALVPPESRLSAITEEQVAQEDTS